ncbi:hypothetical protein SUGI_0390230 [Cryptomeria japonica]|nr:hypothetical protein SUGI_0390230 [Cryptomeria japonica]
MEGRYDSDLELKYADQIAGLLSTPSPQAVEKYYDKLALEGHGQGLKVKQTREMGKGVFAERDFQEEELVLQDRMLVGAQHFSNKGDSFVCSFCFCYIGSIEIQIGRRLFLRSVNIDNGDGLHHHHSLQLPDNKSKMTSHIPKEVVEDLLNGKLSLPFSEHFPLPVITKCIGGCSDESYCSISCAEAAWEAFHSLLCTGERSLCKNRAGLLDFKQHADETNDIFHVAAQVISKVILKSRKGKENLHEDFNWSEVLNIWEPFAMGYKKLWWECVALPEDIDPIDESEFRKEIKEFAWTSLQLLKGAIFEEEYAPLFSLQVYGKIIGMFELNNLDLVVASPVEDYFIYIDDLPHSEKIEAEKMTRPFLEALGDGYATNCEGTAFFPLQSCINHSCEPNCKAFKREQDKDGQAILVATKPIVKGEQIFISYIEEDMPLEEREASLSDYGFVYMNMHYKYKRNL